MRILLAEDERDLNTIIKQKLTSDGYSVDSCYDGKEAMELLDMVEYALLEYLMHNQGVVLSREKIENHIWNYDYEGGTNVVDVYIRYLRKKIDEGEQKKLIHTVRGSGYVLREEP